MECSSGINHDGHSAWGECHGGTGSFRLHVECGHDRSETSVWTHTDARVEVSCPGNSRVTKTEIWH
jgi:hypothetical protein